MQFPFLEGFDDIAIGLRDLGAMQRILVGVSGDIDDRDIETGVDPLGGCHAVDLPRQHDIHQDQVRKSLRRFFNGFLSCGGDVGEGVSQAGQPLLHVKG